MSKTTDVAALIREEAEYSELHGNDEPAGEVKVTRPGRDKAAMLSLRLNPEEDAAIRKIAEDLGIPVSALVRGLIVQRIARENGEGAAKTQAFLEMLQGFERLAILEGIDALPSAGFGVNVRSPHTAVHDRMAANG